MAVAKVTDNDEIMVTTTGGIMIRTRVGEVRETGRNTLGVRIIRLDEGDSVGSLAIVPEDAIEAAEAQAAAEDAERRNAMLDDDGSEVIEDLEADIVEVIEDAVDDEPRED